MSVELEFSNVIVRRDSIENKYPGGWKEWKENHQFWYDDHLYRTGSMGDDSDIEEELKSYGMVGIHEDPQGKQIWKDYCIIMTGPEVWLAYGECDWIEIDSDRWTAKMAGVPDSEQRYISEKYRNWRLRLSPTSHIEASNSGKIETFNVNVFERSDDVKILSNHSAQIMIVDADYEILEHHRLMYGDELLFKKGDSVAKGQQLASFDPHFQNIVAEPSGVVAYFDLIEGQTLETIYDDTTGITSRTVLSENKSNSLKPHIKILSTDGQVRVLSDGSPATYSLPAGCHIRRDEGDEVQPGDVLASISLQDAYQASSQYSIVFDGI